MKGKPTSQDMLYESSRAEQKFEPVAVIRDITKTQLVEVRNRVEVGEVIEYMGKGLSQRKVTLVSMETEKGLLVNFANPGNVVYIKTSPGLASAEINGIIRRIKPEPK